MQCVNSNVADGVLHLVQQLHVVKEPGGCLS